MGFNNRTIKILLFIVYSLLALPGLALLIIGVAWEPDYVKFINSLPPPHANEASFFFGHARNFNKFDIALGTLLLMIAVFGSVATASRRILMLIVAPVSTGALLITTLVMTIFMLEKTQFEHAADYGGGEIRLSKSASDVLIQLRIARKAFVFICGPTCALELAAVVLGCFLAFRIHRGIN